MYPQYNCQTTQLRMQQIQGSPCYQELSASMQKNHTYLMDYILPHLSPYANCVTMTASPSWIRIKLKLLNIRN